MALVIVGILLIVAHFAGIGPIADWPWWYFVAPFLGAVAWWAFSDATGATQRRAMRKMDERKVARRQRQMDQLGLKPQRPPAGAAGQHPAAPGANGLPPAPRGPRL